MRTRSPLLLTLSLLFLVVLGAASSASAGTIAVGADASAPQACAIQASGTVACWGAGGGIPTPTTVPGLDDAVDVSGYGATDCAVRATGSVVCWTAGGTPSVPTGSPSDAVAVATGPSSSCAVRAGGTVLCWGSNLNGELGGADRDGNHAANVIAIAGGKDVYCAIARGGQVSCWGNQRAAVPTDLTDAVSVGVGDESACAVRGSGRVVCWGRGFWGEFGQPYDNSVQQVTIAGIAEATRVTVAHRHVCVLRGGGTATCWGEGTLGQLGQSNPVDSTPVSVSGLSGATDLTTGSTATCARLGTGALSCWGDNAQGLMGTGKTSGTTTPVTVTGLTDATAVAGLGGTRCALRSGGGVSCWGSNTNKQLGDGSAATARPTAGPVTGISTAISVGVATFGACAVLADHSVRCWGNDSTTLATPFPSLSATKVAAQVNDAKCAILTAGGSVSCWGASFGSTLTGITGTSNATDIVGGSQHTCAIQGAGNVVCWGLNYWGFLGDGTKNDSPTTAASTGIADATALRTSVGGNRTCAKRSTAPGHVWCWGLNPDKVPDSDDPDANKDLVPTDTGSTSFPVDTTSDSCAVASGHVTCIGDGFSGQLGDGYQPTGHYPIQPKPEAVPGLAGVPSSPGTTLLPDAVSVSPTSLVFPTTSVGPTSLPQSVTVTNTAGRWLSLYAVASDPSPASEFGVGTTCGATLAPGASCTASYVFHPTSVGDKAGSAAIELAGRTHGISLSGTVSAGFLVTPGALTFPATTIGQTSAGLAVVVVNVSGQTKALDATITGLGADFRSSTTCGATLAPGGTCTITFAFAPTAPGARSAQAVVTLSGVANTVELSGTGVPSNAFTFTSAKVNKTKLVLSLAFPGPGTVGIKATTKVTKKVKVKGKTKTKTTTVTYASKSRLAVKAGKTSVTLSPSKAGAALVKKAKSTKVAIAVTFTPTGDAAASKSKSVTVKRATTKKKKKQ